jgi:hypothetical protein
MRASAGGLRRIVIGVDDIASRLTRRTISAGAQPAYGGECPVLLPAMAIAMAVSTVSIFALRIDSQAYARNQPGRSVHC